MAVKTSYPKDFKALNESLRNSFAGIKKDMTEIKSEIRSSQDIHSATAKELRKDIEGLKQQVVTVDKFNLLKIKLAELGEQLRRIDKVEKSVQELEGRSKEALSKSITDLKTELGSVEKTAKTAVTEKQMSKLVEEINGEFDSIKQDISGIEGKGGKVADARIARFTEQYEVKLNELGAKIQRLQDMAPEYVKRPSMEALLADINKEFDHLKDSAGDLHDDIKALHEDMKALKREAAVKEEVEEQLKQLRKTITTMRADMREDEGKTKSALKEAFNKLGSKKDKVVVMDGQPKPKSRLLTASTIVIIISFLGLGASVASFFLHAGGVMNYIIIGSIVLFVAGIIMRVTALVREESEEQ